MIDVIIPAYNAHKTICNTLFSICMQKCVKDINVTIVDDCSLKKYDYLHELFDDKINSLFYNFQSVAIVLIVFGILFIVVENYNKGKNSIVKNINQLTYKMAMVIGLFQLVAAIFPGTSRSGATILGALLIGVSRDVAAEFTFFLAIPVMFGASLLKLIKFGIVFKSFELTVLLVGMLVAFIVSLLTIKFLVEYIKKHDFKIFGWYRIVLGCILLIYYFMMM